MSLERIVFSQEQTTIEADQHIDNIINDDIDNTPGDNGDELEMNWK